MPRKTTAPAKRDARQEVRILKDHDHRHAAGVVQAFKAGTITKIPPSVAKALIEAGAAEPLTADDKES